MTTDVSPETTDQWTDRAAAVVHIPLEHIHPNPKNPRRAFRTSGPDWDLFVSSIKEVGIQQPILVRPNEDGYEIVAGHRRYAGSQAAEKATIPAIVRDLTDEQALVIMLVENLQRVDLDPIEEATGFFRLVECGMTQAEMAEKVGRSPKHVSERLQLLKAPAKVLAGLKKGVFTIEDALEYAKEEDKEILDEALRRIADGQWPERALSGARWEIKDRRETEKITAKLEADGFRFVVVPQFAGDAMKDAGLTALSDLGMKNSPNPHQDKDWLVAVVKRGVNTVTWATDDKRAARQYAPKTAEPESVKAEKEKERAANREERERQAVEDAQLARAVNAKVTATDLVAEAADLLLHSLHTETLKRICKLLGIEAVKVQGFYDWKGAVREQCSSKQLIHAAHAIDLQRSKTTHKEEFEAFMARGGEA